jgi:hypothetical protein
VLADYLGRRQTLMLSILCYAIFAGLASISWNVARFYLVGILG